MFKLILTRFIS